MAEADDDFKYVLKFRGAGHGVKVFDFRTSGWKNYTEALGLKIPELILQISMSTSEETEAVEEIQSLLKNSEGLNWVCYLSESIAFVSFKVDPLLCIKIVLRNGCVYHQYRPLLFKEYNLLMWHKELWVIDNGASFYFHHSWQNFDTATKTPLLNIIKILFASSLTRVKMKLKKFAA